MTIKAESIDSYNSQQIIGTGSAFTKTAWQLFYTDIGVDVVALGVYADQGANTPSAALILDLGYSTDSGVTITPIFENMPIQTSRDSLRNIQLAIPDNSDLYARTAHFNTSFQDEFFEFLVYRNSAGEGELLDGPLESYNNDETVVIGTTLVGGVWTAISSFQTSKEISYLLFYPTISLAAGTTISEVAIGYSTDGGANVVEIMPDIKSTFFDGTGRSIYNVSYLELQDPVPAGAVFYGFLTSGGAANTSLSVFGGNLIQSGGGGTMRPIQDIQQFANGEPPALGELCIGPIGTDPTIETNTITVYEDYEGTKPINGRLNLGVNGRPTNADGVVFTPYVDQSYSINWVDSGGTNWLTDYINVPV